MVSFKVLSLKERCEMAADAGKSIDISGCKYGLHKRSGTYIQEQPYYAFLAGFVAAMRVRSVLEIGTNCGGSIMAISRGIAPGIEAALLTIDKTYENEEGFAAFPQIMRVQGDSLHSATIAQVRKRLSQQIDLLYIDSVHTFEHVKKNVKVYGRAHMPLYIILDDIHLNESMEKLWAYFTAELGQDHCYDVSALAARDPGFGVMEWRGFQKRWWWLF
jgi:hypothetical protein